MISANQIKALETAARSWDKTPFCEGSPKKGIGVCCHHLCAEIYFEAGLLQRIPVPDGPSSMAATLDKSLIAEWVEQSGLFVEVTGQGAPGDLLGFRIGPIIHHAGILRAGFGLVHCVQGHGVQLAPMIPATWSKRMEKIWRIKALA